MIDIHCHILPSLDDGPSDWDESLNMAHMAVADGIRSIIATPHQLGSYHQNDGDTIRNQVDEITRRLESHNVALKVLPGADVRIEPDLIERLNKGQVLSLGDHRRHVLLELPHELYFPLEDLVHALRANGYTGILSHPERNQGILANSDCVRSLVDAGCLMQITAGSLLGGFGRASKQLAEQLLRAGFVHFLATDAHGTKARRPRLAAARDHAAKITSPESADELCYEFPERVACGQNVPLGRRTSFEPRRRRWFARAGTH